MNEDQRIEVAAKAIKDAEYDYQINGYPMKDRYVWIATAIVRALDIPTEVARGYSAGMKDAEMIHYQTVERMSR